MLHLHLLVLRICHSIHVSDTLFQFLSEQGEHGLLNLALNLLILEKPDRRVHFRQSLQARPEHNDHLSDVYLRLLAQVEQNQHQVDLVLDELRIVLQIFAA